MYTNTNELKDFNENISLINFKSGDKFLRYDVYLGNTTPDENYYDLLNIIRCIISADMTTWPSIPAWRNKFNMKFNTHFPDLTKEQCEKMLAEIPPNRWNELPWDFGSWIDIIKQRSWVWIAHQRIDELLIIALAVSDPNASDLEAFNEIFNAMGVKIIRCEFIQI